MTQTTPPRHLVLYADDDIDDLKFVEQAFTDSLLNIKLVLVGDGVQALDYLSRLSVLDPNPCLIILDVNMPRMNGKEALIGIRKIDRYENIPVVLFTTSSFELDRNFAIQNNAGFVTKPLDARQMQRITDQFIEHCDDEVRKSIRKTFN